MPAKQRREPGFRISIQLPEDALKIVQKQRIAYGKAWGFQPSRSEMITIMVRSADKRRDWLELPGKETNGQ